MQKKRKIFIFESFPVSKKNNTWADEASAILDRPPQRLVRATAWFENQPDHNFMSKALAQKLLKDFKQLGWIEIRYYHAVDQTMGTSRLQVVSGLECDAFISDGSFSTCSPLGWPGEDRQSWMGLLNIIASDDGNNDEGLSEIRRCPEYHPANLILEATRRGILIKDLQSLKAFASLLCLSRHGPAAGGIVEGVKNLQLSGDRPNPAPSIMQGQPPLPNRRQSTDVLPSTYQGQDTSTSPGDIGEHPGHKIWVWDDDKRRWKKRGETAEAQWYPDFFA